MKMEGIWTASQTCLELNIHNMELAGTSKSVVVRNSLDEIIGFQIAYRTFIKALDKLIDSQQSNQEKPATRTTSLQSFFQTSASIYCQAQQREASMALLDKFVDTYVKKNRVLGCSERYINSECPVQPTKP